MGEAQRDGRGAGGGFSLDDLISWNAGIIFSFSLFIHRRVLRTQAWVIGTISERTPGGRRNSARSPTLASNVEPLESSAQGSGETTTVRIRELPLLLVCVRGVHLTTVVFS
jgi:hypothetical protein